MNIDKLTESYMSVLEAEQVKGTKTGAGELEGAKANAKPITVKKPEGIKEPEECECLSQGEVEKGGATKNSEKAPAVKSKFDEYFKASMKDLGYVVEAEGEEVVPAEAPETGISDVEGDFPAEETEGEVEDTEDTDVATELRLMAQRLIDFADKLSGTTDELEEPIEGEGELEGAPEMGEEGAALPESFKVEPEPKPAKGTSFGPKMSKTVSNVKPAGGKAKLPPQKKRTGEIETAKATTQGPKMNMKANSTVKGGNEELIK